MDILYFLKKGRSKCDDFELRCSLRSIEKFGKNVGRVFVVGHCPDWLSDEVIKIPYEVNPDGKKHKNLHSQLLYAIRNSDIGINDNGEFLISMDDHFYIKTVDFHNYPFYVKNKDFPTELNSDPKKRHYDKILINTDNFCQHHNLPSIFSTIHRNMHMNRYVIEEMGELNDLIISESEPEVEGFCIVQNYRHKYHYTILTPANDLKLFTLIDKGSFSVKRFRESYKNVHVFSTKDFNNGSEFYILLKKLYPNKSKYERYE